MLRSFAYAASASVIRAASSRPRAGRSDAAPSSSTGYLAAVEPLAAPDRREGDRAAADRLRAGEGGLRASLRARQPARLGLIPVAGILRMLEAGADEELGELDLHLAGEGRHERIYERLGAHVVDAGVSFAVWARTRARVSVVGDWNRWDGREDPLEPVGSSGIWAAVVPEASEGDGYKFEVHGADGQLRLKADPFAFYAEVPPKTASKIYRSRYEWSDDAWLERRHASQPLEGAALGLRGARGVVAAGPRLEGARRPARLLRATSSASRTSSSAGHAPPVLRLLGLSGDRLLRSGLDARRARRVPGASSMRCTRPGSA